MRATSLPVTHNQKILRSCKNLLIRITRSCPRRHYRHLKLEKASPSSSGKKATKVLASFFLAFQKKQKKEKMKRLKELRSFSDAETESKQSNLKSRNKVFPSNLRVSCLGQGKAYSQKVSEDYDAPKDNSRSAFLP